MAEKALKQADMFFWTGTDKRGVKVKGQTRGNNPTLVKANLRKQGIRPLTVKKQSALFKKSAKKTITPKDLAVFFRQLATMMSAGVPLVQSFEIIGRGHENAGMRELLLKIKAEIEAMGAETELEQLKLIEKEQDNVRKSLVEVAKIEQSKETAGKVQDKQS